MKSSQHAIKAGINRKFEYKLNQKNARSKLIKGAAKNPLVKEMKSTCAILKGPARVKIIIANPAVISSSPPEFRDK